MVDLLTHPFSWGLALGLVFCLIIWVSKIRKCRDLNKEIKRLNSFVRTHMDVYAQGEQDRSKEVDELRRYNENLRITVESLKHKPGRAELEKLFVYDKAVHVMYGRAPGFAPAWERAVSEAENEVRKSSMGLIPLVKKVFRPSLNKGGGIASIESGHDADINRDTIEGDEGSPGGRREDS
ncbi:MAG: hypothetical protein K9N48_06895 [Verrucomicrobia bacterium]|nr:hypothetical protein [Verrucomicrobiota bacterium]MCF7709056.1 hypothetical protein [Verrucomicrobiota bacterium]